MNKIAYPHLASPRPADARPAPPDPSGRPAEGRRRRCSTAPGPVTARALAAGAMVLALAACGSGGGEVPAEEASPSPVAVVTAFAGIETAAPNTQPDTTVRRSAVTASAAINTVDTVIDDMRLNNDLVLAGVPSSYGFAAGRGHVMMGNDPRGTRTPSWWNPGNSRFKSAAWWNVIAPWMVIFDGVGNTASNTRLEMRELKAYYKSRSTGQWIQIAAGRIEGENYPKSLQGSTVTAPDIRTNADGTVSVRPPNGDSVFHGWCCGKRPIDGADVAAIHITLQARLTTHDTTRPDDRGDARYLVQVGGDYYPDASTSINDFAPAYYNPGIGLSRSKRVTDQWQSFSFTTLDVAVQDPGGASITVAELRAAPPPLE